VTIIMEKPLGSSGAIKALLAGVLDIAVSSKTLKPEEISQGAVAREYGKTPLLFATNMDVKVKDINTKDLADIYAGRKLAWGDGSPLRLVIRPEGDVDTKIIRGLSRDIDAAVSESMKRKGMITAVTDPELVETVSKTPGSIGATSLCTMIVGKPKLNPLSLNGVKPTTKALADGSYPIAKDIRFVTTSNIPPAAAKLLDFIYSSRGQRIAEKAGVLMNISQKAGK
jgi:phosphate transport system substrate-binding protein